nr:hypothetical protein [Aeromonas salmonicida]
MLADLGNNTVGRMTTDKGRLEQGYQMGWRAALEYLAADLAQS